MDDSTDKWDKLPNGMLNVHPLMGGLAAAMNSGNVAIRLLYAENPAHFAAVRASQTQPSVLQLAMTPGQVDELIVALQQQLEALRKMASQDGKAN